MDNLFSPHNFHLKECQVVQMHISSAKMSMKSNKKTSKKIYVAKSHHITLLCVQSIRIINQQTLTGAMLKEETPRSTRCLAISFFISDVAS